ncbi:hypothetical protein J8J40_28170, partial [Mycobacterium tuberculosis]|nr:hypothetical protein [Mycobacterium tuberculosis]
MILLALALAGCGANAGTRDDGAGLLSFQASDGTTRSGLVLPMPADVAKQLDARDRTLVAEAQFEALEHGAAGAARDWANPATGHG